MTAEIIGKRYQVIDEIGAGGMGVVYRVQDRLTSDIVALKRVTFNPVMIQAGATLDFRQSLAQEFKVLSSLRHPNIISVLDYGFDAEAKPYYTMELLDEAELIDEYAHEQSFETQIDLLLQLLRALTYLHRRNIIHRDLKPENVMVIDNQIKVLDFGLAAVRTGASTDDTEAVGTIAYMAPEVLQSISPASEASDLYAFGIIAYEVFAGQHPFNISNIGHLLNEILNAMPDVNELNVNGDIQDLIARLIEKDPERRLSDAYEAMLILDTATEHKLQYETATIRESYLQSAPFIGREKEISQLGAALKQTTLQQGSAWLLGGESGVGKSRLMDELRSSALVQGVQVLRGNAIVEGGAPYYMWLPILQHLAIQTELSDLEASVLKDLIPNIDRLIGREVGESPDIDAAGAQNRLINVIEALFKRQESPILLMLEDLQWADEGIQFIERLAQIAPQLALMIIVNYRSEERPLLPQELPMLEHILLERLSRDEIQDLSASIIGKAGKGKHFVDMLERETEGNALFIVEVMRSLANEAGTLSKIGDMTLPDQLFVGGIQTIVQRRLSNIPSEALPMLQIAAVYGKKLDTKVLDAIDPNHDTTSWLTVCSNAAILEVQNNEWSFTHDKLRDGLLAQLEEKELVKYHQQLAETIEIVYPNNAGRIARLAYHWTQVALAQNAESIVMEKAMAYLEKVAEQATENVAYSDLISYIQQLFEIQELYEALPETQEISKHRLAHWHFMLSVAKQHQRKFDQSRTHFEAASELHGHPIPKTQFGLALGITRQLIEQILHRALPFLFIGRAPQSKREKMLSVARTDQFAGSAYYVMHQQIRSLYTALHGVNISERAGESPELAQAYGIMVNLAGNFRLKGATNWFYQRAIQIAESSDDDVALANVLMMTGIYHTGAGLFDLAQQDLQRGAELFRKLGDPVDVGYCTVTLALTHFLVGDMPRAYELLEKLHESGETRAPVIDILVTSTQAQINMVRGYMGDAYRQIKHVLAELERVEADPQLAMNPLAFSASIHWHRGEYYEAYLAANLCGEAAELAQANADLGYVAFGYIAEVYFNLSRLDDNHLVAERDVLLQKGEKWTKAIQNFTPPTGVPSAKRCEGELLWLQGKQKKAIEAWQKSVEIAQNFHMPLSAGKTQLTWGSYLDEFNTERSAHLQVAINLFESIDANTYLQVAQAALNE